MFRAALWTLLQARQINGNHHAVLSALASFTGLHGTFPAHETIAARAGCSVRTVIRALERAYELGIVERSRRMIRHGNRLIRTSNAYRLICGAQDQAKAAAAHFTQQMRDALQRRKKRLSDLSAKTAAEPMSLFNYETVRHSKSEWLAILECMDRGMTPQEAGYRGHIIT